MYVQLGKMSRGACQNATCVAKDEKQVFEIAQQPLLFWIFNTEALYVDHLSSAKIAICFEVLTSAAIKPRLAKPEDQF